MTPIYYYMCATVASVALLTACSGHSDAHDAGKEEAHTEEAAHASDAIHFSAAQAKSAGVQTLRVELSAFAEVIEVSGRILPTPGDEQTVAATMAGIVRFSGVNLTEGAPVSAGQTLFTIDAKDLADGNPPAVAQSDLEAARKAYERAASLAGEHIISRQELEEARNRYEKAKISAESLGSESRTRTFSSSLSGFVKELLVKPGDYVNAGQPLVVVAQSRRQQLRAEVPERFYGKLADIVSANFRLSYGEGDKVYAMSDLDGKLISKGKVSDAADYFVPVIFEFNNRGGIVSGSFAQVYLLGKKQSRVLTVPNEALTEAQGLTFVYVQKSADEYEQREVRTGRTNGRRTEIVSGLRAGEKVVSRGVTYIRLAANSGAVPEGHHH